jgi:hypothetical protein
MRRQLLDEPTGEFEGLIKFRDAYSFVLPMCPQIRHIDERAAYPERLESRAAPINVVGRACGPNRDERNSVSFNKDVVLDNRFFL